MSLNASSIILATRGSPLALVQTEQVLAACRAAFPRLRFEMKIIKTTGDKLQRASMAQKAGALPKGLFTKELETALLRHRADLAVHSLKDLPTELPAGLRLAAVLPREDVRDVLLYRSEIGAAWQPPAEEGLDPLPPRRSFPAGLKVADLPKGATVATSSTRRREQLSALRPDLRVVEIRGNVGTRLNKLLRQPELDATILAAAGLKRLGYEIRADGTLACWRTEGSQSQSQLREEVEFRAAMLSLDEMLPCVGQGAIGLEIRAGDERMEEICRRLNHYATFQCVTAERAFLRAMGGGCQSPVAALAEWHEEEIRVQAVSFRSGTRQFAQVRGPHREAESLGLQLAAQLDGTLPAQAV